MQSAASRVVLVTGSGTGLGRAIALQFAREGADVAIHYGHDERGAQSAQAEIASLGRKCQTFRADFADVQQAIALVEAVIAHFGRIDCLVNNSGITLNKPFHETKPEWFDLLFNVNFKAQFFITQRVIRQLIERGVGGAICNIASIHGLSGAPEHSLYAATKGAIIAFTRTLAIELAHQGIRVNAIAPGWVAVENHSKAIPDYDAAEAEKIAFDKVPLGRSGYRDEIAKLATFLCSDAAGYIVGQTIVADGGTTALMSLMSDFRTRSSAKFGTGYVPGI